MAGLEGEFAKRGVKIIGISVDPVESHSKWKSDIKTATGFDVDYPLIGDKQLEVAKLKLQAAQKEGDALVARGQADANVILLNKQAEAEPLRQQVAAFGGGESYAQYFFYQKVAPAVKSILTNTDGPFGELFRQMSTPVKSSGTKMTDAKQ